VRACSTSWLNGISQWVLCSGLRRSLHVKGGAARTSSHPRPRGDGSERGNDEEDRVYDEAGEPQRRVAAEELLKFARESGRRAASSRRRQEPVERRLLTPDFVQTLLEQHSDESRKDEPHKDQQRGSGGRRWHRPSGLGHRRTNARREVALRPPAEARAKTVRWVLLGVSRDGLPSPRFHRIRPVARLLPELGGGLDPHEYGHDDRDREDRGEERHREHEPEPLQTPTKGM
jgi:hypothetical protein